MNEDSTSAEPPDPRGGLTWAPQDGPQTEFVGSEVFEVIYGGARGGGKTDAVLGDFGLHAARYGEAAKGLLVRRTRTALEPTIARARQIYRPMGARWRASKSFFEWPSGAVLYFRHLDNDADADLYQGHDYSRVYVEEMTHFPSSSPIDRLKATLRSAGGAHCGFRATCNPGGAGHVWVKQRYIDPGAYQIVTEGKLDRVFIPARVQDNPRLLDVDPNYEARLRLSGSAELVRAWLEGDWTIVEGAFFDGWSVRNVIKPFAVPRQWFRFRSFDWGHASPFSVGWWAMADDDYSSPSGLIPRGALVRYREWYGGQAGNRKGARLEAEQVAAGILERELKGGETIKQGVADPSIFASDGGASIGDRFSNRGVTWIKGDNTRVGKLGALSGWDQMRARIRGDGERPMLYVFETCFDFIRTVPSLQHDRARAEDLDTNAEDHIADETRYACLFRVWTGPRGPEPKPRRSGYDLHAANDWEVGWKGY